MPPVRTPHPARPAKPRASRRSPPARGRPRGGFVEVEADIPRASPDSAAFTRKVYVMCYRYATGEIAYGERHIPMWDGGRDQWGTNRQPVWPKLAAKLANWVVDPLSFFRVMFTLNRPAPSPIQLMAETAREQYDGFRKNEADVARQFDMEMLSVRRAIAPLMSGLHWTFERSLRYALMDRVEVKASSMLRYVLAARTGIDDVKESQRTAAVLEYAFRKPEYDACENWAALIQDDFRDAATEFRQTVMS